MAYDEGLAQRVRECLQHRLDRDEKKMFGGLCFLLHEHMCCGIVRDTLMCRVGPDNYDFCLAQAHTREMDFTGKAMKGLVYVESEGIAEDEDLRYWVNFCVQFVDSLPPKKPKTRKS